MDAHVGCGSCMPGLPGAAVITSCLQAELVEAQAIAEEKARELAVANGLVAEKTRQYAEVQRIAAESEQTAAALDDKFRMQMLETKAERCVHCFAEVPASMMSLLCCMCLWH